MGIMAESNLDMASGDCLSCSDTDDVSMQTAQKKFRKRVRVSCKLNEGSDWTESQMKELGTAINMYGAMITRLLGQSGNVLLVEDYTSSEMRQMMTRTDQLLYIAEATGSKIYTRESGGGDMQYSKGLGLVHETVPCLFLQALQEGDHQVNGGPPRPTL